MYKLFELAAGVCLVGALLPLGAADVRLGSERRLRFTEDWRFHKGDASGAEQPGYDDSQWRRLNLPHDWAIEGPFDRNINPHAGALPYFGTGWYRKQFTLSGDRKDRFVSIEFDGAMSNSRVWINGHELGGRPFGYISFGFDITPYLQDKNVIAVRLTPEDRSSRWYPGAGLYRNVWLDVTGPLHVARWGTYITTPEVSDAQASVAAKIQIQNRRPAAANFVVQTTVLDAAGQPVSRNGNQVAAEAGAVATVSTTLTVKRPQRWDTENPYLYTLVTEVLDGKRVVDRYTTPFGIRTIAFEKGKGFSLNGRTMKLQGVCMHHDLGALGAAVNRRAIERQLQILKGMGVNAVRTSHNPPAPELLEYCDRMGLLVMDEAFDVWRRAKIPNDYSKYFDGWSERDVRDMVRRDRDHPSIILWSAGNEILEQSRPDGADVAARLVRFFHEEDPTRPVTAGLNQFPAGITNGIAAKLDVPGFNYKATEYAGILRNHPEWVIVGAETSSAVSSRGVYHLPLEKYQKHPSLQLTSYDLISPPWAYIPDVEFYYQEQSPAVVGEFVWTGFDYLGEPTPYFQGRGSNNDQDWPARSSYFGIVDLAGFPKDRYYLYQSVWTKKPMVHILPHWNWAGMEGKPIPVTAYTNADEVELFLNGKSLGRKKRGAEPVELPVGPNVSKDRKFSSKYRLMWEVPYEPGVLKAVAYGAGKQVAATEVRTAGAPARVQLIPDRKMITADGDDLSFVTVRVEDKDGNLCPNADNLVRFKVSGPARIAAVDNGNAATVEPFQADSRKAFSGLALVIIRSEAGKPGAVRVEAMSEGLASAQASITTNNAR